MAQQTDAELTTEANVIRNEAAAGANTKVRVADMVQNLNDSKINNDKIDTANDLNTAGKSIPGIAAIKAYIAAALAGAGHLTAADIDTLAEINAIITDADLLRTTDIIGVQDLFIPASAMWPRATAGCASLTRSELATSLLNIQTLDFDQTTQEFAQFTIVLPRKYNNSTVTVVFYWTASAGAGAVVWGIRGGAYSDDDALTVAMGTEVTVTDTLIAQNDLHISSATAAVTLAGTPADADFLGFQISRLPADAGDTLTADAKLLGVSIRITTDAGKDA